MQLEQILANSGYTYDDLLIVACPTPEQVSVFISSASLISHSEPVLPYGKKKPTNVTHRPSLTSLPENTSNPHQPQTNLPPPNQNP